MTVNVECLTFGHDWPRLNVMFNDDTRTPELRADVCPRCGTGRTVWPDGRTDYTYPGGRSRT